MFEYKLSNLFFSKANLHRTFSFLSIWHKPFLKKVSGSKSQYGKPPHVVLGHGIWLRNTMFLQWVTLCSIYALVWVKIYKFLQWV